MISGERRTALSPTDFGLNGLNTYLGYLVKKFPSRGCGRLMRSICPYLFPVRTWQIINSAVSNALTARPMSS